MLDELRNVVRETAPGRGVSGHVAEFARVYVLSFYGGMEPHLTTYQQEYYTRFLTALGFQMQMQSAANFSRNIFMRLQVVYPITDIHRQMLCESSGGTEFEKYQRIQKIGEGTYGIVYKARDKDTSEIVAIKKIRLDHEDQGIPSTAVREISLLRSLKHPNIVFLKEVLLSDSKLNLVFEFVDCDLKKYLQTCCPTEEQVKHILYQLLLALQYCHANRIIHRDLKPQNILIDREKQTVKLADFGLARTYSYPKQEYTHEIITLWYRAPQVLLGADKYYPTVDSWSVGCIFYELVHKRCLFCGDSEIDQIFKIFKTMGTPVEAVWPDVSKLKDFKPTFPRWTTSQLEGLCTRMSSEGVDLLKQLLLYDPVHRITVEDALNHPYFHSLSKARYAPRNYV